MSYASDFKGSYKKRKMPKTRVFPKLVSVMNFFSGFIQVVSLNALRVTCVFILFLTFLNNWQTY